MSRLATLRRVTPGLLVLGLALMLPFEATIPLVLGIALMFAFVVCGVFLIADPAFLEGDDPHSEEPHQ